MNERPTIAAEDLEKYSDPRLDEACKELFKNKPFLAPILKACVPEFQEYDTEYLIEHCIGEPEISTNNNIGRPQEARRAFLLSSARNELNLWYRRKVRLLMTSGLMRTIRTEQERRR